MMQVVSPTELDKVIHTLKEGGVVAYPTETSYGLGCDVENVEATKRIFVIKQRPPEQSLIMLVRDVEMAKQWGILDEKTIRFVQACWPGPVTGIFWKRGGGTCAMRVSSHPFVQHLFEVYPHPIYSTSLNLHGQKPCYSYKEFTKQFSDQMVMPELFVDAGVLPEMAASVLVDLTKPLPVVVREGSQSEKVKQLIQDIYGVV